MDWFDAHEYEFARQVLQRGVAAVYLVAFSSTLNQFRVLLGERGLLPATEFARRPGALRGPTIFRWYYSDRMLAVVAWAGIAIAATLVLGLPQSGPPWLPLLAFLVLWVLYMSIVNIGQVFYGFGWESLLLEAGFTVAFLGSNQVPPPLPVIVLTIWLVFRLEFGAGMIKMRGDKSWRDLTALYYHHETQPMPNPVSRRAHLLPKWFHRVEVLGNHFAQLVVPFVLFVPGPVGSIAALVVIFTQAWLVLTGNFAWLNVLTMVLAFAPITDGFVHAIVPWAPLDWGAENATSPAWWMVIVGAASVLLLWLSWPPLRNLFSKRQLMNASFNRWSLANAYGAFGSVTKHRFEVVVEGTLAERPSEEDWREYEFKGKPGDVKRTPGQFAPYHLRLDWLMWFLALGSPGERWFFPFLTRLLEADGPTLALLARDPFDGERPRFVRARLFRYRFASDAERRATGNVWMREPAGEYVPPVSLQS